MTKKEYLEFHRASCDRMVEITSIYPFFSENLYPMKLVNYIFRQNFSSQSYVFQHDAATYRVGLDFPIHRRHHCREFEYGQDHSEGDGDIQCRADFEQFLDFSYFLVV